MNRKQRTRRRLCCEGKNRHETQELARIEIYRSKEPGLETYKCPFCHKWHIGHLKRPRYED